jgi:hypothetical protein
MTNLWTIEVHQTETGAWVGVVKRRPQSQMVRFMSACHCTATFAFSDCLTWIKTTEQLEVASADLGTASAATGAAAELAS